MKSIKLRREQSQEITYRDRQAVRIQITAIDPVDVDSNIFLFLQGPTDPLTGETVDYYQGVASPYDMSVYPIGSPSPDTPYPMYRLNTVTMDHSSIDYANQAYDVVKDQTQLLLSGLGKLEALAVVSTDQIVG